MVKCGPALPINAGLDIGFQLIILPLLLSPTTIILKILSHQSSLADQELPKTGILNFDQILLKLKEIKRKGS